MKKNNVNAKISTILGKGCVLNGDFNADGSARIDGTVNGNVDVKGMMILGVDGKINGDVSATGALIGGHVTGNIDAPDKLEMSSTAKVLGDIKTQVLVIDEHAIFQGKCDMYQEVTPAKKTIAKPSVKATRAGKKSAKAAIVEALKEVEEENRNLEEGIQKATVSAKTAVTVKAEKEEAKTAKKEEKAAEAKAPEVKEAAAETKTAE